MIPALPREFSPSGTPAKVSHPTCPTLSPEGDRHGRKAARGGISGPEKESDASALPLPVGGEVHLTSEERRVLNTRDQ
jgi:hypothetical protein